MIRSILLAGAVLLAAIPCGYAADSAMPVNVPAHIDDQSYNVLLKKYVNGQGLVAYSKWKANKGDLAALDKYLAQYAAGGTSASGGQRTAELMNAYNAFTIQWILKNYPTESIWATKNPFDARRNQIGGKAVSLNDIEKATLIPAIGWKTHAELVCAARSCPPLRQSAYEGDKIDLQIDDAFKRWLARPDLNQFLPDDNKIKISSIFKWYKNDFAKIGGPEAILKKFAPPQYRDFIAGGKYKLGYLSYNWGLNDQGKLGRHYSKVDLFFDNL